MTKDKDQFNTFKLMIYDAYPKAVEKPDNAAEKSRIALLLINYRKANNLTQKELADRLHVPLLQVNRWERRKNLPSQMAMEKLKELRIL